MQGVTGSSPVVSTKKKDTMKLVSFFLCLCPQGHNIVLQRSCKHHLTERSTSFRFSGHKTKLPSANSVVLRTNDITPCGANDVLPSAKTTPRFALIYSCFHKIEQTYVSSILFFKYCKSFPFMLYYLCDTT